MDGRTADGVSHGGSRQWRDIPGPGPLGYVDVTRDKVGKSRYPGTGCQLRTLKRRRGGGNLYAVTRYAVQTGGKTKQKPEDGTRIAKGA